MNRYFALACTAVLVLAASTAHAAICAPVSGNAKDAVAINTATGLGAVVRDVSQADYNKFCGSCVPVANVSDSLKTQLKGNASCNYYDVTNVQLCNSKYYSWDEYCAAISPTTLIIIIVVSCVVGVALIIGAIVACCCCCRRKRNQQQQMGGAMMKA